MLTCVIELKIQILYIRLAAAAAARNAHAQRPLRPTTRTLIRITKKRAKVIATKRANKVIAKVIAMEMRANKVITNNLCE